MASFKQSSKNIPRLFLLMQVIHVNYGFSSTQVGVSSVLFKEGELASLEYEFPLNPSNSNPHFTITTDGVPFYQDECVFDGELTKIQRARFSVECKISTNLKVMLLIRSVKVEDANLYICQIFRGGDLLHTQKKDLHVLPRNLSCAFTVDHRTETLNSVADLTCSTRLCSENRFMSCYQETMRELSWKRSVINTTHASQTLSINLSLPVFCCLSHEGQTMSSCNCNDFVWMPSSYPNKTLRSVCEATYVSNSEDTTENKSNCSSDSTPTKIHCDSNYREFSIIDIVTAIVGPLVLGALVVARSELKEIKKQLSKMNETLMKQGKI